MNTFESFVSSLNSINDRNFEDIALQIFQFQAEENPVYRSYLQIRKINPTNVQSIHQIPFLPISFFKNHHVKSGRWTAAQTFSSSGTTDLTTSQHHIWNLSVYHNNAQQIFEHQFGSLQQYHLLALLPSYLERKGSSLISMIQHFIHLTQSSYSGFYLYNHQDLLATIDRLKDNSRKVILWGVSFALLDLAETGPFDLSHCIILETGGMKGRRKELIREEFHSILDRKLKPHAIYSEYGMTELLSQSYTNGSGYFQPSKSMKVVIRDINDPYELGLMNRTGGINIIDLANFHSCAFIETQDLGKIGQDGSFEVLGRFDNSDLRGCNLLI